MQDLKLSDLIVEFRLRTKQLSDLREEDFLSKAERLGIWLLTRPEFDDAIGFIDKSVLYQNSVISGVGMDLEKDLNNELEELFAYKIDLGKDFDDTERFYYEELQKSYKNEKILSLQDAYNFFRIVNMRIYAKKEYKDLFEQRGKVRKNEEGLVVEFVPQKMWEAWVELEEVASQYKDEREENVQGTISHLRQLTLFKNEYEWRNSYKSWREIYGKSYYIPRFQELSNYLYDYYILNIKPDFNVGDDEKVQFKKVDYQYKDSILYIEPGYGCVSFDPKKKEGSGEHLMGIFVKALAEFKDGIDIKKFKELNEELNENQASSYRSTLNSRFNKMWEKRELKVFLYITSEKNNNSERKYALKAYRIQPSGINPKDNLIP